VTHSTRNTGVPPSVSPIDPAAPCHQHRVWVDAPLRAKVITLVILAAIGGNVIGVVEAKHESHLLLLSATLTAVVVALMWLGRRWIWQPYEQLVETVTRITRADRPSALQALPLTRRDEVGQLARSLHQLTSWAIRDHREACMIRRTLDRRVAEATRVATRQLRHMAMRDALTDLGNRHFLEENLEPLVESIKTSTSDLVCMLIDVDNFKPINDHLGHAAGDEILILLASLIRASIRQTDYAVRLGGDEFIVLMPGCNRERARLLAQQLSTLFRQHTHTTLPTDKPVSLSIGIASLRQDGARNGHDLLDLTDRRLYQAKRAGKAQTVGV